MSTEPNTKHREDYVAPKPKYDIGRVDFEWVEKCEDKKELYQAYEGLKEDGGFRDLERAVENRLKKLDPIFKRRIEGDRISQEEQHFIAEDIANFLNDIQQTDNKLKSDTTKGYDNDKSIFGPSSSAQNENKKSLEAEEIERKKFAEYERLKGNECMASKDYQDAIQCYSKSLEYYPNDPATYSNRALAYLNLKEFARVIDDSNAAIKLKDDYLKAYHRRGKAYLSLNKIELAIRDFQYILEKEPNNKDAMQLLKNARGKLDSKLSTTASKPNGQTENKKPQQTVQQEQKANKFVRVAIEEESDEDEQQQDTTQKGIPSKNQDSDKENNSQQQEKQEFVQKGIEVLQSQENDNWWKSNDMKYEDFKPKTAEDQKKSEPKQQENKKEEPQKFHRVQIEEDEDEEEDVKLKQQEKDKQEAKLKAEKEQKERQEKERKEKEEQLKKEEQKKAAQDSQKENQEEQKKTHEQKERDEEKKRVDSILEQADKIKEEASVQFNKSMYEEAAKIFQKAADLIESNLKNINFNKKLLIEREAQIFNNIAACYKQTQHTKQEIEYCTKVIDRAPFINDLNVLAKAYQRRGYAYEQIEKFQQAKDDMTRVKEIQPNNQQASQALTRIHKALKDVNKVDLSDIDMKLGKIKDEGNKKYGEKKFKEAIDKFTEGIDMYLKDQETFRKDKDVKTKVTQMYTNRALSFHQLNIQLKALEDAEHVLKYLDHANPKALFRRAIANKSFQKYDEAVRDLQVLFKQDQTKKDIKQELDDCMKLLVEQQKSKKDQKTQEQPPKVKIQEVSEKKTEAKQQKVEEEEDDDTTEEKKKTTSKKMKNLNQETINKAMEITNEKINQMVMKNVPKTAAGFEADYNSLKKDLPNFYQYLKNIPVEVIETLFKNSEIPAEVFAAMMRVTDEYGLKEDVVRVSKLMTALSKASSFDMTLMFMDKAEKKDLIHIIQEIKKSGQVDKETLKKIDSVYNI